MARLIEVQDPRLCPSPLTVRSGDVLLVRAAGSRVVAGGTAVELLGTFVQSVVADNGEVMTPAGPPNAVLFCARRPGSARLDVVTGDPFHAPVTTALDVTVGP